MEHEPMTLDRATYLGAEGAVYEIHAKARVEAAQMLADVCAHARAAQLLEAFRPILASVDAAGDEAETAIRDAEAALLKARRQEALAAADYWTKCADDPDTDKAAWRTAQRTAGLAADALDVAKQIGGAVSIPRLSDSPTQRLAESQQKLQVRHLRRLVDALEAVPEPDVSTLAYYLGMTHTGALGPQKGV